MKKALTAVYSKDYLYPHQAQRFVPKVKKKIQDEFGQVKKHKYPPETDIILEIKITYSLRIWAGKKT
jgi:hypothetical protein